MVTSFAAGWARTAAAAEIGSPDSASNLELHGFVSQGFIKSTSNNYLTSSERGSFEFSEVGLNFTTQLTDKLRVGLQLFAFDLGPLGNYSAKADWYSLDYRFKDWLGFRAGRLKLPFGLYNDTSDIDAARAPVLLPSSVYPATNRDFFLAQTGMELYGYLGLRRAGALDYRLYAGTIFLTYQNTPGAPYQIASLTIPYVTGGRLMWETPLEGLRLGGSGQALKLETTLVVPGPSMVNGTITAWVGLLSVEYAAHDLLLAAEYGRTRSNTSSSDPASFPAAAGVSVSESAYALAAYRVTPWLQPAVYYSVFYPYLTLRDGREDKQHDLSATLRFDVNDYWIIKIEGHYMHGTARLSSALNGGLSPAVLDEDWGLFLVKTTAYF